MVDRRNHHLFQPLLYQVATGDLSPANIAAPLRYLLRKQTNCTTIMAEVVDFDIEGRKVILRDGDLPYDYLVVAAGATHSYFGNDHWEPFAPGLKTIEGATEIRSRVLKAFEVAERETDPAERAAWLTFVIVGAGPTGTELAGALSEISNHTLLHDFRNINPADARIILIEAGPHALGHYPKSLCEKAEKSLRELDVELQTETMAIDITEDHVMTKRKGEETEIRIPTHTVIWAAGVAASPLAKKIAAATGATTGRAGHIEVGGDLTIKGHPEIMAIGDMAMFLGPDEKPLPGLAPVAMQQGDFVGARISALTQRRPFEKTFNYKDRGSMAVIGRFRAVALVGTKQISGFTAWMIWLVIHLMEITLFSSRILVVLQWGGSFFLRNRSARLITSETVVLNNRAAATERAA